MVASMQAMNENNVISSFKIFIDADCSNLGGDAKNWAKCAEIQGTENQPATEDQKGNRQFCVKCFQENKEVLGGFLRILVL